MYTYVPAVAVPVKATPKPAAATASVPSSSTPWYGPTANEVDMQNRVIMDDQMKARQLKGHVPSASDQYWCRELDGLYTVRTAIDIYESCTPGYWTTGEGNYPYFVREEANS